MKDRVLKKSSRSKRQVNTSFERLFCSKFKIVKKIWSKIHFIKKGEKTVEIYFFKSHQHLHFYIITSYNNHVHSHIVRLFSLAVHVQ